jgi:hypothetical protein
VITHEHEGDSLTQDTSSIAASAFDEVISLQHLRKQNNTKAEDKKMELAEKSAKYVGKKGIKVGRRGMKGAKHLGTSVKSVLAHAPGKKSHLQPYHNDIVNRGSIFFHQSVAEEEDDQPGNKQKKRRSSMSQVPTSQMERFSSVQPDDASSGDSSVYSDDDSDSSSTSNDGSAVLKVSSQLKTKTIDASDKTEKKKNIKEKKPKNNPRRVDFAGQITADDDDESNKKHKRKKKKSKKSKKEKKKKKPKREIRHSLSDSNLADTEALDFLEVVKPPDFNRRDTQSSGLSADPSTTSFLSFVERKDREKAVIQIQESMEKEMEDVNLEKESLQFYLDEETMKNKELTEQINKLENELHRSTRGSEQSEEVERMYSELESLQMELINERETYENQASESRKEIEALKKNVDVLKRNDLQTRVLTEIAPAENKTQERLRGELLEANARVAELQRSKKEQDDELVNIREELASHKDQYGIHLLREQLKTSQEQENALRTALGHVENDWTERLKSKEETIEFFLKELSRLKLQQATGANGTTGANGMSTSRLSPEEVQNVLKIQPDAPTRPGLEKKASARSFAFWRR